jgi:AcrR family transcriptional regulator
VPRAFSARERELIRRRLRDAGLAAFSDFGLRRTSVDELVKAASISKGAFYLFYDSKEALLLELLEHTEAELQKRILEHVLSSDMNARQSLEELVRRTINARHSDPLLRRLSAEELEQVVRRVPPERAQALRRADVDAVSRWLYYWRARGVVLQMDAEVLSGVLRALVFATSHQSEIGLEVYTRVIDALVQGVVSSSIEAPRQEEDEHAAGRDRRAPGDRRRSLESRLQG